jgi:biotin-independent malonate decarboxylase gamma subunit
MSSSPDAIALTTPAMLTPRAQPGERARFWLTQLGASPAEFALGVRSVLCSSMVLGDEQAVALAVVRDASSRFPRAAHGEMGLEQALALSAAVRGVISEDEGRQPRAIVAVVDTPGQAFGRVEERECISFACASAVEAYALARRAGHPVLTLVVGRAVSGAFLAHGMQSDVIVALGGPEVSMYAMGARSAARITRRTVEQMQTMAETVLPMSYAIVDAHKLGIIDVVLSQVDAEAPTSDQVEDVRQVLAAHLKSLRQGAKIDRSLRGNPYRVASVRVRDLMRAQWDAADAALKPGK